MRKNIAYIISHLAAEGPVNVLYGIVKNIDRENFNPIIITLKKEKNNSRIEEFKKLEIKVIFHEISDLEILCKKTAGLKLIIEKEKIDIIHTHCLRSSIFIAKLKIKNIVKLSTLHCDFSTDFIFSFGTILGKIYNYLYLNALKKMDLNISCGEGVAKLILKHSKLKTEVVQNGIDREKINIKNIEITKEELRQELNLKLDEKYFISVSSLDKRKNVLFLADYFKETDIEGINLILVGDGEKREEIMNFKNSKIKLTGKLPLTKVQRYLKASDYYVSASKSEGLPNSVLEALEFELPVLLSNIEPHKEVLENYDCGEIFEINDVRNFEEQLQKLLKNKKKDEEFKRIKFFIDAKRMSKEYEKIYYKITNKLEN